MFMCYVHLFVDVDSWLWSSPSNRWWNDWICGNSLVPCSRDHAELDAL